MVNGEAQQLGVHVAIIVAVGHGGIIARTYTSPADAETLLVRLGGIEQDCFTGHAGEGLPFYRRLRGESRSARSQADIDFALGGSAYAKGVCPLAQSRHSGGAHFQEITT